MPTIDIDKFDETPKVGDKIRVKGTVKSIDEDNGEVEVTYGDVSIVDKKKRKKRRDNDDDDWDDDDDDVVYVRDDMMAPPPESQSLDNALAQAFPRTQ